MKTDRLTLLIAPADKAAITQRADALGLSVSELVRQAALAYDPQEERLKAELEALIPVAIVSVERIEAAFDRMLADMAAHRNEMTWLQSDEHRAQVRREVEADPRIDWAHIERLRRGLVADKANAA